MPFFGNSPDIQTTLFAGGNSCKNIHQTIFLEEFYRTVENRDDRYQHDNVIKSLWGEFADGCVEVIGRRETSRI